MKKLLAFVLSLTIIASQCVAVNAAASDTFNTLERNLSKIETLLAQCEGKGLDVSYERIDYNTIKDFIGYGRQDISWWESGTDTAGQARAEYVADKLEEMYDSLYEKLNLYNYGSTRPSKVKKNTVQNYSGIQNGGFVNKDGEPIIFTGYGLYGWSKRDFFADVEKFKEFGSDVVQIEITPNDTVFPIDSINGWYVTKSGNVDASATVANVGGEHNNALRIVNNSEYASNVYICIKQNINVSENTKYNISFMIKSTDARRVSYSPMEFKSGTRVTIQNNPYTYDWKEETSSYTTAAGETELKLTFFCEGETPEFLIDDIVITEEGKSENIVQNGDFEDPGNTSEHFRAWSSTVGNKITRMLDHAEENDIMVDVLIQPATFSRITNMYPEIEYPTYGVGYDIYSDIAKEALDLYVQTIMGQIKDHPALLSICISNEPSYDSRDNASEIAKTLPKYQAYLKDIYNNNISALNSVYGESNSGFSSVQFPTKGDGETRNAKFYEWAKFNNTLVSGWNEYVAGLVKTYAPNVKVHSKMRGFFGNSNSAKWGVDPEDFNQFTDIMGIDGYAFYNQEDNGGVFNKVMMYELLKAIAPNKPVINSEDHIYIDGSTHYDDEDTAHGGMDFWQGAIHGRDANMLWVWNRTSSQESASYGNILYRPDVVSLIGKTSLDLNKLAKQVKAFQNKTNYVTFLWSDTNFIYTNGQKRDSFRAALYAGANPTYITERQLIAGQEPSGVLVIPDIVNVRTETYNKIKAFIQNGGTVWAIGNNCLTKNERNQSLTKLTFANTFVNDTATAKAQFETLVDRIVWGDNNKALEKVEILTTESDGDTIVNLVNYDWSGGNKRVYFSGKAINLLTNQTYNKSLVISPYVPVLLRMTDNLYALDADIDISESIDLTASVESKNTEDMFGKVYFKIFDSQGNIIKSVIYEKKLIESGKTDAIKSSFSGNSNAVSAEVGVTVGGNTFKREFDFQ